MHTKQFHKNKYFLVKKKRILISMVRETGFISTFVYSSVVRNKHYEKILFVNVSHKMFTAYCVIV